MVRCPVCGEEVSVEEYSSHYDAHQAGRAGGALYKDYVKRDLSTMKGAIPRRDVDTLIRAGMEALVGVGRLYEQKGLKGMGPMYNGIATAVLSSQKGDWPYVESSINGALRDLEQF